MLKNLFRPIPVLLALLFTASHICAQRLEIVTSQPTQSDSGSSSSTYVLLIFLALVCGAIVAWLVRGRVKVAEEASYQQYGSKQTRSARPKKAKAVATLDETTERSRVLSQLNQVVEGTKDDDRYLPIFAMRSVPIASHLEELPDSDEPQLLVAIENSNEELQPDAATREEAVQTLARFRTASSIEALSQAAVYDPSASLRSTALATLASFDHGSVFEPIIIACADPTREVRAAASRALSKLTFSRSDEWFRIAASDDIFRVRQCAKAAIAAGLHEATLTRLVNRSRSSALEAFAIVSVLIRAGETEDIIDAILGETDEKVATALLHVIDLLGNHQIARELRSAGEAFEINEGIREQFERVIDELDPVSHSGDEELLVVDKNSSGIAQKHTGV